MSKQNKEEVIFCDDIYEYNQNSSWDLNMFANSVSATGSVSATDSVITHSSPYIYSCANITQAQVNSYADEMSGFMECYTPNYGMFDVDKDIIGPSGGYKKEDMKVVLDDIQKWMKTENEDRYVVHVLAVPCDGGVIIMMIDSYGESFHHGGGRDGCIPRREWHKGIVNYQPSRGHLASRVKKEYGGLSKYKFTDTMIDTVKGFYSDKKYEWGYMVQNSDVSQPDWIYDTLHCKTLERMREVAKKEFEKYEKYKRLYYKMNVEKAEEIRKKEEEKQKDMELYTELLKKYGVNLDKTLKH